LPPFCRYHRRTLSKKIIKFAHGQPPLKETSLTVEHGQTVLSIHLSSWPVTQSSWEINSTEKALVEDFLKEIQLIRKEKSLRKIALNAEMSDYQIQTTVNLDLFAQKLQKITKIKL